MKGRDRIRVTGPRLRSWDEVDQAVKEVGLIELEVEAAEAALTAEVTALREAAAERVRPHQERRENLVRDIKEFVEAHKADMLPARSRELVFGTVGFRLSTSLKVKSVAETLELLRKQGMKSCIRTKEEIDKEALKDYGDEVLAQVGVSRKVVDAFFLDVNRERIRSAA